MHRLGTLLSPRGGTRPSWSAWSESEGTVHVSFCYTPRVQHVAGASLVVCLCRQAGTDVRCVSF